MHTYTHIDNESRSGEFLQVGGGVGEGVLVEPQRSIAASLGDRAALVTLLHTQSIRPVPAPQRAIGAVEAAEAPGSP